MEADAAECERKVAFAEEGRGADDKRGSLLRRGGVA